jgi:hypothetical protein
VTDGVLTIRQQFSRPGFIKNQLMSTLHEKVAILAKQDHGKLMSLDTKIATLQSRWVPGLAEQYCTTHSINGGIHWFQPGPMQKKSPNIIFLLFKHGYMFELPLIKENDKSNIFKRIISKIPPQNCHYLAKFSPIYYIDETERKTVELRTNSICFIIFIVSFI